MADPITEKIIAALADYLKRDAASIRSTHHLRDDLGLDSMAVIELLYRIEETFELQIPDQDLPAMTTVGSVAAYVQRRLAPAATPTSSPGTPVRTASRTPAPSAKPKKVAPRPAVSKTGKAATSKARKPAAPTQAASRTTKPKRKA